MPEESIAKTAKKTAKKTPVTKKARKPGVKKGFQKYLDRMELLGMSQREKVWDLHIRKGLTLIETAEMMNITRQRVAQYRDEWRATLSAQAPKSATDFEERRVEIRERLYAVLEDAGRFPNNPKMLAVRLKTLQQLSELDGLNTGSSLTITSNSILSTPESIIAVVQQRALSVHGRQDVIEAARAAQEMRDVTPESTTS